MLKAKYSLNSFPHITAQRKRMRARKEDKFILNLQKSLARAITTEIDRLRTIERMLQIDEQARVTNVTELLRALKLMLSRQYKLIYNKYDSGYKKHAQSEGKTEQDVSAARIVLSWQASNKWREVYSRLRCHQPFLKLYL
jgi:hypothetical protein